MSTSSRPHQETGSLQDAPTERVSDAEEQPSELMEIPTENLQSNEETMDSQAAEPSELVEIRTENLQSNEEAMDSQTAEPSELVEIRTENLQSNEETTDSLTVTTDNDQGNGDNGSVLGNESISSLEVRMAKAKASLTPRKEPTGKPPLPDKRKESKPVKETIMGPAAMSPAKPVKKKTIIGPVTDPPSSINDSTHSKDSTQKSVVSKDSKSIGSFTAAYFPEVAVATPQIEPKKEFVPIYHRDPEAPSPPTEMAYIGDTEDVSTIANDTMAGSINSTTWIGNPFSKNRSVAPEKSARSADANQLPPGFNGTVQVPSKHHLNYDDEKVPKGSGWSPKKYTYAIFLGLFLLSAIAALSYGLIKVREFNSLPSAVPDWDWTFKPTSQATSGPTTSASPTSAPTTKFPTMSPTTFGPTDSPSSQPSMRPTQAPSDVPTFSNAELFKEIMRGISESAVNKMDREGSPQREALIWLGNDPSYDSYSEKQLVQRWVLASFSLQIATTNRRRNRRLNEALEDTWMTYTDECYWFTSWYENRLACDGDGTFKFLVLRNIGLDGTIPSELALLSRLDTLILSDNTIKGTIPKNIRSWPSLENFEVANNRLTGTIPDTLDNMMNLGFLDLGGNQLVGEIPEELAQVRNIQVIKLNNNQLSGQIPNNVRNLDQLVELDVTGNLLMGSVPDTTLMVDLKELHLNGNNFSGVVPPEVCAMDLDTLTADCDKVYCECCTNCKSEKTASPTVATPSPTRWPTRNPTPGPTHSKANSMANSMANSQSNSRSNSMANSQSNSRSNSQSNSRSNQGYS